MDDSELLRQFASGSQEAFADLARRYADLVYSAALRQTRDHDRAQDVTQAVFILLARKAPHLRQDVILSAWLFKAVGLVAREQARSERRREIRERKAAMMREEATSPDVSLEEADQWAGVSPLLDEGINRLPERYRVPLLLRFFEGRSFAELAAKLGLSEATARQRVHRAISKLRSFLTRRGIHVTAGVLSTGLTHAAVHAAPPTIVSAAAAAPALAGGTALVLAHGTVAATAFFRAKALAMVTASITLAAATVTVVTVQLKDRAAPPHPMATVTPVVAAPAAANRPPRQTLRRVIPRSTLLRGVIPPVVSGTVIDDNGRPLSGADVMIVTPRRPLWVNARQWFGGLRMTTGADGRFAFPPIEGEWDVVACNDSGFAQLTRFEALSSVPVKLRPWARVEGTLWVNNQPKPDGEVHISNGTIVPSWGIRTVLCDFSTKTDARGHFEFPHVVPGEVWLDRQFPEKRGSHANFVFANAEPGKTLHIDIAKGGGSIAGKVSYEGDPSDVPQWTSQESRSYSARLIKAQPTTASLVPQPPAGLSPEQVTDFYRAWEKTDQGRSARRAMLSDDFPINPDGTFRFDGVMPGDYVLAVSTYEWRGQLSAETVSTGQTPLRVGEADARSGKVLDVGTLTLRPVPRVKLGSPPPELNATYLDGTAFDPSLFKGKPVVLQFWNKQVLDQVNLNAMRQWAASNRVAAIGVNGYDDPAQAASEAKSKQMNWPQIRVPSMWPSSQNWIQPGETVLIDSAGNVIARHSLGQANDTVTQMLHSMGVSP